MRRYPCYLPAADDTEYGLNASVWGSDVARIQKIADQLYVGSGEFFQLSRSPDIGC